MGVWLFREAADIGDGISPLPPSRMYDVLNQTIFALIYSDFVLGSQLAARMNLMAAILKYRGVGRRLKVGGGGAEVEF